jgi:hypothetical protein
MNHRNARILRWTPGAMLLIAGTTHSLAGGPFPATLELSSLNGANGFVLNGINASDFSGSSVSSAGDINGDGVDDLIIGAYSADPNGSNSGESYVVFGGAAVGAGGAMELASLNGANGFVINGIDGGDNSGISVSSAGDINGDGAADLIIGANLADPNGAASGECYVVFGGAGVGAGGALELSAINGANGFVINGIDAYDYSGFSVSSAGDFNGDGAADLIIGARGADPNGSYCGESYVVFGGAGVGAGGVLELSSLNGANGFVINGIDAGDYSGISVSCAGDFNGDGAADIIIGARGAGPNGAYSGESYVVFGGAGVGAGGVLELSSLNGANGFVINGIDAYDLSGFSVSSAGDANGDGFSDLIIGAIGGDPNGSNCGETYVVFGGAGAGVGGALELSSLNGANGFVINGIDVGDSSGVSVSGAGDVNGDGAADLIIGAYRGDPNASDSGESYVVFGGPGLGAGGTIELSALNGVNGFVINGIDAVDFSGRPVSTAGDVNDDGASDLIIGAQLADPNGNFSGESYVVFGRPSNIWDSPVGGDFDDAANWLYGAVPAGGVVVIDTVFGVTVSGPSGALFIDRLTLGAAAGRTTLDLQQNSLVSIADDFTIPASGGVAGDGALSTGSAFTNDGLIKPSAMNLFTDAGLTNNADINIEAIGPGATTASLGVFGALTNSATGEILIRGLGELETTGGLTNSGVTSIAFAQATVRGPVTNAGDDDGMDGFDPLGLISISGASEMVFTDDLLNQSDIVLTTDSSLVILGSLTGNGVSGPGGGSAGEVFIEGDFNPGFALSAGLSAFGGDLNLGPASVTTIELGGALPGVSHDLVTSGATLAVAGDLEVTLINGFVPGCGDTFTIMTAAGGVTASFGSVSLPALTGGLEWDVQIGANEVQLVVGSVADLNGDNVVDTADLGILIGQFGTAGPDADINGDGIVDTADLGVLIGAFGSTCP